MRDQREMSPPPPRKDHKRPHPPIRVVVVVAVRLTIRHRKGRGVRSVARAMWEGARSDKREEKDTTDISFVDGYTPPVSTV